MNNETELISIVLPVYNVKEYIDQCMQSIITQSYHLIEIIMVDDGSTDGSGELCEIWAKKDPRVKVIHQVNGGLSCARNVGIRNSTAKYITLIDTDDFVSPDYIKNLWNILHDNKADLSITCALKFYDENKCVLEHMELTATQTYSSEEALENMLYRKGIPIYAIAKLYNKSLFDNVMFPEGELFEDMSTEYLLFHAANKIAFNPVCDYYYRQRKGSIVNSNFNRKNMIQIRNTEKIIDFIKKNYPSILPAAKSKSFITAINLYRAIPYGKEYAKERRLTRNVIKKYRSSVIHDKEEKSLIKCIAAMTYISIGLLGLVGKTYQYCIEHGIIKVKKQI